MQLLGKNICCFRSPISPCQRQLHFDNFFSLRNETLRLNFFFGLTEQKIILIFFQNQESVAIEADNKHFSNKKTLVTPLGDLFMKSSLTNEPLDDSV